MLYAKYQWLRWFIIIRTQVRKLLVRTESLKLDTLDWEKLYLLNLHISVVNHWGHHSWTRCSFPTSTWQQDVTPQRGSFIYICERHHLEDCNPSTPAEPHLAAVQTPNSQVQDWIPLIRGEVTGFVYKGGGGGGGQGSPQVPTLWALDEACGVWLLDCPGPAEGPDLRGIQVLLKPQLMQS